MQTIHNTNDGIYYLTDALNLLLSYFQKHTGLTGIFSNSTELLKVKNILYFSAKNLKLSELELKSLNSPLYFPFMYLLNLKSQTQLTLSILNKFSEFVGGTLLNLVGSIEDYMNLMYQLTREILRRAYWWELEKNNITYNPRTDFYNKFNSKTVTDLNQSVLQFNNNFIDLENLIDKSYLKNNNMINVFYSQMDKLKLVLHQVVYLSKLAPPLLNATFTSVEVTNALAFDQFVTAKNLTALSQKYLNQSQEILNSYSFDPTLSSSISDIGIVMDEINDINHEFLNMTYGTQNMFLNLSKSIQTLNETYYSSNIVQINLTNINLGINISINYVSQVVQRNIDKLNSYLNRKGSSLRFPFTDILAHFLWFYNGYDSAVDGYRSLWETSNETIGLFSTIENLQNSTLNFLNTTTILPFVDKQPYQLLSEKILNVNKTLGEIGNLFNESVTDGAIKINTTLWENLLGFNKSLRSFQNTGFNEYFQGFT